MEDLLVLKKPLLLLINSQFVREGRVKVFATDMQMIQNAIHLQIVSQ